MYKPKFSITNKILTNISKIEAAKEIIENAPLVPQWERQFKKEAALRTAHYSTHLEGNPLELEDVKKIADGRKVIARERDVQEIINYRKVMDFIEGYAKKHKKDAQVGTEVTKEIHKILTDKILASDRQGAFRVSEASSRDSLTWEKAFDYPPSDQILAMVTQFINWLKSPEAEKTHPLLKSGVVHHELVRIHPFDEANGRAARTVATLSLYLDGYDIKNFFCLEEYFDSDPRRYYNALSSIIEKDPDLTLWLEYFTQGLADELTKVKERVLNLSRDQQLKKVVGQVRLNERQEQIVAYIEEYGQTTNKDWQKLFEGVSDDTILRDLKDLMDKKIVVKRGKTKAARYELR